MVYKNLRGQSWKDVLVDFNPVRSFLTELEVDPYYFDDVLICRDVLEMQFCGSMMKSMDL